MKVPNVLNLLRRNDPEQQIPGFDPEFYRTKYPDVAASGMTAALHYIKIGRQEHRDPNAYFSAKGYLSANPDVAAANFDPLSHFLIHGIAQNYCGWQRHPVDEALAPPRASVGLPTTGGVSDWNEAFASVLRKRIERMERAQIADPLDDNLRAALDYVWFHERRWVMTFKTLSPYLDPGASVIEVGGASSISEFLAERGLRVAATTNDLREPMTDVADSSHDMVLCLEVIEHIKDRDGSGAVDIFNGSGVRCLVSEMHRIAKPGGIVVCTTPNGCSYSAIARAIVMEPPMFFRKHVREFTPDELKAAFEEAGFETLYLETPPDPWGQRPDLDIAAVKQMIVAAGGPTRRREDDIVALFKKPS